MAQHYRKEHFMRVGDKVFPRAGSLVNREGSRKTGQEADSRALSVDQLKALSADELQGLLDEVSEEIEGREKAIEGNETEESGDEAADLSVDEQIEVLSELRSHIEQEGDAEQRVGFTAQVEIARERVRALKEIDEVLEKLKGLSLAELEAKINDTRERLAGTPNVGFTSKVVESVALKEYLGELEQKLMRASSR